jgi:GNAT superfamily N-acetyltransferase
VSGVAEAAQSVRILRPRAGDPLLAAAARAAARSRLSVRRLFPEDGRYAQAFGEMRPAACLAAVEGGEVVGVIAARRRGRDAFRLTAAGLARLYGPLAGRLRLLAYRAQEALTSGPQTHVSAFWTDPRLRGRGVGGALLSRLIAETEGLITLLARPGREAFYRRHGFAEGGPARLRLIGRLAGFTPMRRLA